MVSNRRLVPIGCGRFPTASVLGVILCAYIFVHAEISPILEDVVDNCDGTYTASFGYHNYYSNAVVVEIGPGNYFAGDNADLGQPRAFEPGRAVGVFEVVWDGKDLVWVLGSRTATASKDAAVNSCGQSPVSPVLERVIDNCDGTVQAWYGYSNPNSFSVEIPNGSGNKLTGSVQTDSGRPTTYLPGRVIDAFSVTFSGANIVWTLNERTATAAIVAAENRCGEYPVMPFVAGVVDNCDGTHTVTFGYTNPNDVPGTVKKGADNVILGSIEQPQPARFQPGTDSSAFTLTTTETSISWYLDSTEAVASIDAEHSACSTVSVRPVLERVIDNCDGSYQAIYGYLNQNAFTIDIPVGGRNRFHGMSSQDQGQPTAFLPGRNRNVFSVPFDGNRIVWILEKRTSTASGGAAKNECPSGIIHVFRNGVTDNCDSTWTAWFGYESENNLPVHIDIGPDNYMTGLDYQPQVTTFEPGRKDSAFSVVFAGQTIVWNVEGRTTNAGPGDADGACVCPIPRILTQPPSSLNVALGDTVELSIQVAVPDYTITWLRNDVPVGDQDDGYLSGGDTPALTIRGVRSSNHLDVYKALVENGCGRSILTEATLLQVEGSVLCRITESPHSDTVEAGYPFFAEVDIRCSGGAVQWYRDGGVIAGATSRTLITEPVTQADSGAVFMCVVDNGTVRDSSGEAVLSVVPPRRGARRIALSGNVLNARNEPLGYPRGRLLDCFISLYTSKTGGTSVYSENFFVNRRRGVYVDSSRFTVELGRGETTDNLQQTLSTYPNLFAEIQMGYDGRVEVVGPRVRLSAAPYAASGGRRVLYGEGSPIDGNVKAEIGCFYVDRANGNVTWKRNNVGWGQLD